MPLAECCARAFPKIRGRGTVGQAPPNLAEWLTHRNTLLPACYHTEFGRSRSNRVYVGGSPQNTGAYIGDGGTPLPLKMGACRTFWKHAHPHCKLGRSSSNGWCIITEVLWNIFTARARLSRSLVTDTDQSAARDCRIVFHSISDKRVSCTFTTCAEHLQTVICFKLLNECLIEFNFVAHWPKVNIWIFCYVNLWYLRRYFTSVNETEVFFINLVFTGALFCHHISSFFGLPNLKQKESKDNTYNYSKPAL